MYSKGFEPKLNVPKTSIFKIISYWPPFLVSGIRIRKYLPEVKRLEVAMSLRFWNWNHERAHFGGSLYAMTDPFYALLIRENLEEKVQVWVKSAQIKFRRPGRGVVHSFFELTNDQLEKIQNDLKAHHKSEPDFHIEVLDSHGKIVAEVSQIVHVSIK